MRADDDNDTLTLLRSLAASGRRFLRFPPLLETSYRQAHRQALLDYYHRHGLAIALLALSLVIIGAATQPWEEMLAGLQRPLEFHRGMPVATGVMLACMFALPVLVRIRWLEPWFETWFVLVSGTALGCVILSLMLVESPQMQYLWVLGVVYGHIILYALSRQALLVNVFTVLFSFTLTAAVIVLTNVEPEWQLLPVIGVGINVLGIMLGYMEETREREIYLQQNLMQREQQSLKQLSDSITAENRLKERVTALHDVMSGENDLRQLGARILRHLVPSVNMMVGVLYHRDGDRLFRLASHALADDGHNHPDELALGETMIGQCAVTGEVLSIDQAPPRYLPVRSALGERPRPALLLVPLKHESRTCAVLELAGFGPLNVENRQFIDRVAPSLAVALSSVYSRSQLHRMRNTGSDA